MKLNHNWLQQEQDRGLLAEEIRDSFQDTNKGAFVVFNSFLNSTPHRVGGERKHSDKTEIRRTLGEEIYKPEMTQ